MVGIARPENFSAFIRKVGYSVGLEKSLERFSDFCRAYAATPQLKHSDWLSLVEDKWDLKTTHIADVFSSLKMVQVNSQGVFAGPIGEAGGLVVRLLSDPLQQERALQCLFGLSVMLSDGDVFFNCLSAAFDPKETPKKLIGMVICKRQELFRVFKSQQEREAIATAITIERQKTNKGGASKGGVESRVQGGLSGAFKGLGLPAPVDVNSMEPPSADYLRHVLPARKEWARSLSLCEKDGAIRDEGWQFLKALGEAGLVFSSGEFNMRPTKFELEANRFGAITELTNVAPSTWDYVKLTVAGLRPTCMYGNGVDSAGFADFTKRLFGEFRELSQDRRMVRNEVPLFVALAVYAAIASATSSHYFDYDDWLRGEEPIEYGIKTRTSRTIELGILIPTNGSS